MKNDIDSLISMTWNKLLTKYNLYEEIDKLEELSNTKNKSIDEALYASAPAKL